jgi:glucose-6-phosphate dehydrogenase assembly protein OpcA
VETAVSESDLDRAAAGEELPVDYTSIEKSLAELWRGQKADDEHAVTRAALWNVVAHTSSTQEHANASEVLGRASIAVPQRTIVVRANPAADPHMASWISANCHMIGGGKQVCSEEISIVAGGDRIHRVPPLVNALLIPDMPVAVWWIGDLPGEHENYVESLLEPADRLIVDSVHFDAAADLALISRIAERTTTAPADLNWVRLEEWRTATASVFDAPALRSRLRSIRRVRLIAGTSTDGDGAFFGELVESLFYASWLSTQAGHQVDRDGRVEGPSGQIEYRFERRNQTTDVGGIAFAEILFDDGTSASISRDRDRGILTANVDGTVSTPESVTRAMGRGTDDLIVRMLKRPEADRVFVKVISVAARMAKRLAS